METFTLTDLLSELDRNPSIAAYAGAFRKLPGLTVHLPAFRAAILSNHTLDIGTALVVESARRGMNLAVYAGGYDQYRQELLDPQSGLSQFQPDAIFISLHLENTFPNLPTGFEAWLTQFQSLLSAYRERSSTPVFLQNFIPPTTDPSGLLAREQSLLEWVLALNTALRRTASSLGSVYVVDAAQLACASHLPEWRDTRLWCMARVGIPPRKFPLLAGLVARCFRALRTPAAKCLILDLDNTVWGGILGEAGPEGIHCAGNDYPGNAYAEFQRALLALRSRGILLAVASKNERAWVDEAFEKRSDMPLRAEHITDWEISWEPKPEALRRIASRLNIGLDSLVFLDDNPAEIDLIKMALPQVRAYRMPSQPSDFADFLSRLEDFDQLQLSSEDARRAELYELRRKQTDLAEATTDLESFYRSLGTVLSPEEAEPSNFERIVQLFQKTNQFNLTTRRYTKPHLQEKLARGSELWAFRAKDVHGDHGIIAVSLLDFQNEACEIESFLMSCRVIGRALETAILHFLEERAGARGYDRIVGNYLPTPKNGLCREFYASHGFEPQDSKWVKDLRRSSTPRPEWITIAQSLAEVTL